jgi:hypothetical protein
LRRIEKAPIPEGLELAALRILGRGYHSLLHTAGGPRQAQQGEADGADTRREKDARGCAHSAIHVAY